MGEKSKFLFKDALKKLESIVNELEDDTIDLEDALKKYEEGVKLVRQCNEYLEKAELKLKELEKDQQGRPVIKEMEGHESAF